MHLRPLLPVGLLLFIVGTGSCLSCLLCKDLLDCKGNTTEKIECHMMEDVCFQIFHPETGAVFRRACGAPTVCDIYAKCSTCNVNDCNSSMNILPSFLMISLATVIAMKLF
ncbi:hypothetical protein PPYR_12529 [Photinus pyralis]|uniref:UPAR/Ly6 domain-containing protein n=1 Tax=Photinus pyralis TaxID=7054 RepID=A0A5N4A6L9_PHOPY|nr:uncharacterized protein LOC116177655 [Photinus pyralis]KAB0792909.1 hypothetical protein PPYR_12529 [Photinus pyralis]